MKARKKKMILLMTGLLLASMLGAGLVVKKVLFSKARKAGDGMISCEVVTGQVDSTVSATGNLSMDDTTNVVVSTGIIVDQVLVETGDKVKKGDILARLDKTSVVSELIEAKETKEELEDQLDDDLSDLELEKINGEIEEIDDRIEALEKLHDDPVIRAAAGGC